MLLLLPLPSLSSLLPSLSVPVSFLVLLYTSNTQCSTLYLSHSLCHHYSVHFTLCCTLHYTLYNTVQYATQYTAHYTQDNTLHLIQHSMILFPLLLTSDCTSSTAESKDKLRNFPFPRIGSKIGTSSATEGRGGREERLELVDRGCFVS